MLWEMAAYVNGNKNASENLIVNLLDCLCLGELVTELQGEATCAEKTLRFNVLNSVTSGCANEDAFPTTHWIFPTFVVDDYPHLESHDVGGRGTSGSLQRIRVENRANGFDFRFHVRRL